MSRSCFYFSVVAILVLATMGRSAKAARPGESLLPNTTKGFFSTPDYETLRAQWEQTQLGQLANDPAMEPFIEDLREQLHKKLSDAGLRLAITGEDLQKIAGGEVSLAVIQPEGDKAQHAMALLVDVTGRTEQARALLAQITRDWAAQGATHTRRRVGDITLEVFTMPRRAGEVRARQAAYALHQDQWVAVDHAPVAGGILVRLQQPGTDVLQEIKAFQAVMAQAEEVSGQAQPNVRWFVEPFGYMEVLRAAAGGPGKRGTDLLQVLQNQGFDAIQGGGGYVLLATDDYEMLHYSLLYAPPVQMQEEKQRYRLAARMLDFPNREGLIPQNWVPQDMTGYLTFNWRMREAFEYSKTLVDEIASDEVFEDVLESILHDPHGPQVDIRKELVGHFAERATMVTDYRTPITPQSERLLFAIELKNPQMVASTVHKAMESDPEAKKREHNGHVIWEIVAEDPAEVDALRIDGAAGFGPLEAEPPPGEKPLLPHAAITVAHGHLLVGSHIDLVVDILEPAPAATLAEASDYQRVTTALENLGAGEDSFRFFSRTDEAVRVTYELLRQGRMPEAETMLGRVLNELLAPEEEGVVREQEIDGSKLPEFDQIRQYLGPAGMYVRSGQTGWLAIGCLLSKPQASQQ